MPVINARFLRAIRATILPRNRSEKALLWPLMGKIIHRTTCRISGEKLLSLFSLGDLYMSDFLPTNEGPRFPKVPLELTLAAESGLIQLRHTAPFDDMYKTYWYRSSTNESMVEELRSLATSTAKQMRVGKDDLWIDIGCNDGTLLSFLPKEAIRIGYDPNDYREISEKHASLIVNDYFNAEAFRKSPYS